MTAVSVGAAEQDNNRAISEISASGIRPAMTRQGRLNFIFQKLIYRMKYWPSGTMYYNWIKQKAIYRDDLWLAVLVKRKEKLEFFSFFFSWARECRTFRYGPSVPSGLKTSLRLVLVLLLQTLGAFLSFVSQQSFCCWRSRGGRQRRSHRFFSLSLSSGGGCLGRWFWEGCRSLAW